MKGGNSGVKKKKKGKDGKKTKPAQDAGTAPALADEVSEKAKDAAEQAPPAGHKCVYARQVSKVWDTFSHCSTVLGQFCSTLLITISLASSGGNIHTNVIVTTDSIARI